MTQKELAEKIGVKEQQIQRYEANHYDSASFERLREVFEALGISFKEIIMKIEGPAALPKSQQKTLPEAAVGKGCVDLAFGGDALGEIAGSKLLV